MQRQPTHEDELEDEEEKVIQAKETPGSTPEVTPQIAANINALRGGGQPLPDSTRAFFEPRFGVNFNGVRVHTGTKVSKIVREVQARAFTMGDDIAFGAGQYASETNKGRRLLAHELVHVVQQNKNKVSFIQKQSKQPTVPTSLPIAPDTAVAAQFLLDKIKNQLGTIVNYRLQEEIKNKQARDTAITNKKKPPKAIVPFPLLFKRLWLGILKPQLKEPRKKARTFWGYGKISVKTLNLNENKDLFPDLYTLETIEYIKTIKKEIDNYAVAVSKGLKGKKTRQPKRKSVRNKLIEQLHQDLLGRLLSEVDQYTLHAMNVKTDQIKREFSWLSPRTKGLLHGGDGDLESYYSARLGLLGQFGSPAYPKESIDAANKYYSELVHPTFLIGKSNTLTHNKFRDALIKAEDFLKRKGWFAEAKEWFKKVRGKNGGYWSTTIRENGNDIKTLSDHSFGFAMDLHHPRNLNLAGWSAKNWQFIDTMLGKKTLRNKVRGRKVQTWIEKRITAATNKTPEEQLRKVTTLHNLSDEFKSYFTSYGVFRNRLQKVLINKGIPYNTTNAILNILNSIRLATKSFILPEYKLSKKDKKAFKEVKKWIDAELESVLSKGKLFAVLKPYKAAVGEDKKTERKKMRLVKSFTSVLQRNRRFRTLSGLHRHTSYLYYLITNLTTPLSKQSKEFKRGIKELGLKGLFYSHLVKQMKSLSMSERSGIANRVIYQELARLEKKEMKSKKTEISSFIWRAFHTFESAQNQKPRGIREEMPKTLGSMAVYGFVNQNPKVVTALMNSQGGNLDWLGVKNNDMHHFQLKNLKNERRSIPKASEPPNLEEN